MVFILSLVPVLLATAIFAVAGQKLPARSTAVYLTTALTCAALLAAAGGHLLSAPASTGSVAHLILPLGLPWLGAHFRLDTLAALFLLIINLGGLGASIYGLGYARHESAPDRVLPFFAAFLAAMNMVLLAADAFTFLLSWEFMSLVSWALVMAHHRAEGNSRAGYVYLLMASFGTLCLLLAFGLLAGGSADYDFATLRSHQLEPALAAVVLLLTLLGAGSKAGLVPLHAWLPLAHPAAPSHVSALMSGVMTKVAVYGFIRLVFDLLGTPAWWWGELVLVLGGISAVLGLLYALLQNDLKRLLAYSTVENIGVIFIGLGLALAFQANGLQQAAALALSAALLHIINHSLFKSLLFYCAGSVLSSTGLRDMNQLGGLIHRLPQTAFAFLAGSAAIAALPPLNGFVSEWLIFQAILLGPELPQWALKFSVPAVGALLALAAALAAGCFVKAFGISFLGRPRSDAAAQAQEVNVYMRAAPLLLVALCVFAGVFPGLLLDAISPVVAQLNHSVALAPQRHNAWLSLVPVAAERSSYNGLLLLLFMLISGGLTAFVIHRAANRRLRRSAAWDCGFPNASPLSQYAGDSFAQPLRRTFGTLLFQARETVTMPPPGDLRPARLQVQLRDPIWDTLYQPLERLVTVVSKQLNRLQFLTIRRYLSLVFAALIFLLTGLALWQSL